MEEIKFWVGQIPGYFKVNENGVCSQGFQNIKDRQGFLDYIDNTMVFYKEANLLVVSKAETIITQLKEDVLWGDIANGYNPDDEVLTRPDRYFPIDIYVNGDTLFVNLIQLPTELKMVTRIYPVDSASARVVLLELTTPYHERCKQSEVRNWTLPLSLKYPITPETAYSFIDTILNLHIYNYTFMSANELAVCFKEKLADVYEEHEKLYGVGK